MELALTQDTRRVVDTAELARATREAGFTALGMVSGRCSSGDRALLAAAGLRCHELLGIQIGAGVDATLAAAERIAPDAAELGAEWVLATFQTALTDDVRRAVTRCPAVFAAAGSGLAVEFSPLSPVATIADGEAAVTAAAAGGRAGLVIDSWNFCLGAQRWDELETVPLERIAYLQFADALAPRGELDMEEAMTRRSLPGAGVLDLDRFATTLRRRGWDGVVSLQVLSDDLRRLPVEEFVRAAYDAAKRYWL